MASHDATKGPTEESGLLGEKQNAGKKRKAPSTGFCDDSKDQITCDLLCQTIFTHVWMHIREFFVVLTLVVTFLLLYYLIPEVENFVNGLDRLHDPKFIAIIGALAGDFSVLLPIICFVDKGPWLSIGETWAIMRAAPSERKPNDLADALAWKLVGNAAIFTSQALLLMAWYLQADSIFPVNGDNLFSSEYPHNFSNVVVKALYTQLTFAVLLTEGIVFSMMFLNNAGNFLNFVRAEKVCTFRQFIIGWGLPPILAGIFYFLPVDFAAFLMPDNVQVIIGLAFGIFFRILENSYAMLSSPHLALEEEAKCPTATGTGTETSPTATDQA